MNLKEKADRLNTELQGSIWMNKKKKTSYLIHHVELITTNAHEGDINVAYYPLSEVNKGAPFSRELKEFYEKFSKLKR